MHIIILVALLIFPPMRIRKHIRGANNMVSEFQKKPAEKISQKIRVWETEKVDSQKICWTRRAKEKTETDQ